MAGQSALPYVLRQVQVNRSLVKTEPVDALLFSPHLESIRLLIEGTQQQKRTVYSIVRVYESKNRNRLDSARPFSGVDMVYNILRYYVLSFEGGLDQLFKESSHGLLLFLLHFQNCHFIHVFIQFQQLFDESILGVDLSQMDQVAFYKHIYQYFNLKLLPFFKSFPLPFRLFYCQLHDAIIHRSHSAGQPIQANNKPLKTLLLFRFLLNIDLKYL